MIRCLLAQKRLCLYTVKLIIYTFNQAQSLIAREPYNNKDTGEGLRKEEVKVWLTCVLDIGPISYPVMTYVASKYKAS